MKTIATIKRVRDFGIMVDVFTFTDGTTGKANAYGYRQHPKRPGEICTTVQLDRIGDTGRKEFAFASMPHDWEPRTGDTIPEPYCWH